MAIPLLGPTESINDTPLDNLGDCRRLSNPDGCQTCSRRSPTGNQQWLAGARGCYLSRPDRSLRQRRDRARRACAHYQRTRSKPYQQAHLSQVGHLPATGGQTVSSPRVAPKIANGPKNQRPHSESHVPPLRESHALGTDSLGTQSHGLGRTQRGQQAPKTSSHFDRGGIWSFARSVRPSLSLYGPSGRVHGPSYQRSDGPALESDRLRKLGHASEGRVRSQPGHEAEIRVFPGRLAAGSRGRHRSSGVEASLYSDARRLGFPQPTNKQTLRFWYAPEEGTQGCCGACQDSGTHRLAYAASQLPRLARRDWCASRRTTETHASREHLDHDERLWWSLHGIEAQSQYIRGAAGTASRPPQIAKGRHVDGLCSNASNLIGPFQTTIENPNSS